MNNGQYKTKWGALLNIISNRNYSTPQIYKIFYFGYYFFTILIALAVLFNKNYVVVSILSAIVFVLNGRKYEDKEWLITEYLPISFKERVRQVYLTTYIFLLPAVMLDYAFRYIYYQANIIEYIYVLLTVIIISNLAIIQMILTRRSFWNFIALDVLIYALAVKIISIVLNGLYLTTFDNTKFNLLKIIMLIILAIIFQVSSTKLIIDSRRKEEISIVYQTIFIIAITLATALQFYQGMYWVK
jgi:putative membrane protein